mgnify:CR=1 FL=1
MKMRHGLIDEHVHLRLGPINAEQREEGRLARLCIFLQRLARDFSIAFGIQNIVSNLESKSHIAGVAAQAMPSLWRDTTQNGPGLQTEGNKRTCFQLLQPGDGVQIKIRAIGNQIHLLDDLGRDLDKQDRHGEEQVQITSFGSNAYSITTFLGTYLIQYTKQ